ncbi:hypothetical protein ACFVXG_10735 [Kitasatospora sp. NPDC058162]|uniref:hypothetical protein n=1 Tax=Kitasatospora sp. NPDC058162 TaxID=3346362 RepID=UPI0036DF0C09
MTDMRRFVRKVALSVAVATAVLGLGSLVNVANSHDVTAAKAVVSIADDLSWQ